MRKHLFGLFVGVMVAVGCGDDDDAKSGQPGGGRGGPGGRGDVDASRPDAGDGNVDAGAATNSGGAGGRAVGSGGAAAASGKPVSAGHAAGGSGGVSGAGASSGAGSGDQTGELFDPSQLPRFDIDLSTESKNALAAAPATYARATLRYGSITLQDVGVRIKGEASLRTLDQKAAFKLKLDEFVADQTLLGMHRLTLNNMVSDNTFMAERLTYYLFLAAGVPAPRCNNALVYVNGEFYGVYANVESEDKPFLRRWFASDAGNLYEDANGPTDLQPGNEGLFDLETNETKNDRSDLKALTAALAAANSDTYLTDLESVLDTDGFLHFAALEATVNQWDGYSYTYYEPNNFRLYHDPSKNKFVFLPWGMDLSMKPFYTMRANIPLFVVPRYEDRDGTHDSGGLLLRGCLASTSCKSRLAQVSHELITLFEAQKLHAVAAGYYAQIKDHVYEETRKEITNQQFEEGYQGLLTTIRNRTTAMKSDLSAAGL